jgi:hypothetical protein
LSNLALPVLLRALGDEVRALKDYVAQGLLTQEEAIERITDWELFYPPGWWDVVVLADARRHKPQFAEAAE